MQWSDYFYYDETSPTCLRWKVDRYSGRNYKTVKIRAGDVAGSNVFKDGLPRASRVMLDWKTLGIHRIIWELFNGAIPEGMLIDHLDGNPHNNIISNLECKTCAGNSRNRKLPTNNKTGLSGVSVISNGKGRYYAVASWKTLEGKTKQKCFSIDKLGEELAISLAKDYRKKAIEEINLNGAGYTERHGK